MKIINVLYLIMILHFFIGIYALRLHSKLLKYDVLVKDDLNNIADDLIHLLNNNIGSLVQTGYDISSRRKFGNSSENINISKSNMPDNNQIQKEENNFESKNQIKSAQKTPDSYYKTRENPKQNSKANLKTMEKSLFSTDESSPIPLQINKEKIKKVNSIFDDIQDTNKTTSISDTQSKINDERKLNVLDKSLETEIPKKDEISMIFHNPEKEKIGSSFDNLVIKLNQELIKTNNLLNKIETMKR